jgi:hypothetical protein
MNTSRRRVQTVHGPIDASKLGFTLSHEHICNCTPEFREKWPKSFGGREGLVARAVEQLKSLRASGVDTLIDLTPFDVGRDIRLIEEVSRKSGIQIVACDPSAEKSLDQVRRHGGGGNAAHAATSVFAAAAGTVARPGPKPLAHVGIQPDAVHVVIERLAQA